MKSMHIGLIGAGAIANSHLFAYSQNPLIEKIAIADINEETLARMKGNYPKVAKIYRDYKKLLEDETINVVDICLPHYLHHRVSIDSLTAGKDVICEKPIALTLEEADDMIESARKLGRRLFINMNQRFMPYHKEAKKTNRRWENRATIFGSFQHYRKCLQRDERPKPLERELG